MSIQNQKLVERYMAACTAGDKEELLDVLASAAVHYFSPGEMEPVAGATKIAELWLNVRAIEPRWTIDNIVSQEEQVVVEFTNTFLRTPGDTSSKTLGRGCEWYRIEKNKITEIRAYFESDYTRDTGLTGYPYEAMGYTTKTEC